MSSPAHSAFPFPKLDIHTHILPDHIPDFASRYGYGDWIRIEQSQTCECKAKMFKGQEFFREIDANCYRAEPRLSDSDASGVLVQALSTVPVMFSYWAKPQDTLEVAAFLNDHIQQIVRQYPKRFVGLATLPMQAPELAVAELKRCMAMGFAGIQIATHINDMPLGDPALFPIFQACEELGACVFVHPWDMAGQQLMKKYWLPWLVGMPAETSFAICSLIFSGVLEKLPKLRICFAHGGGSFPGTIGRIEHGFHCRPDLVACDNPRNPREYLKRFFIDSLVHDPVALKAVVELFGAEQICLGTDYPFPLGEEKPGLLVENAPFLSDEEKASILWTNGLKFLGLQHKEQFYLQQEEPTQTDNDKQTKGDSSALADAGDLSDLAGELLEEANSEDVLKQIQNMKAS